MLYDENPPLCTDRPLGNAISLGPANGILGKKTRKKPSVGDFSTALNYDVSIS
jgi:hypothetical protein